MFRSKLLIHQVTIPFLKVEMQSRLDNWHYQLIPKPEYNPKKLSPEQKLILKVIEYIYKDNMNKIITFYSIMYKFYPSME